VLLSRLTREEEKDLLQAGPYMPASGKGVSGRITPMASKTLADWDI